MICDLCRHWKRSRKIRFTMAADRCSLDTQMDELATLLAALKQSVNERDVLIQDMHTMIQEQSETQDQSGGTPIPQPELHRKGLARVKEFDGNDDKFVVEHQNEVGSDQHEEFTQKLKGRVAARNENAVTELLRASGVATTVVARGCACRLTTPVLL